MSVVQPPFIGFAFYVGENGVVQQTIKALRVLVGINRARYGGTASIHTGNGPGEYRTLALQELIGEAQRAEVRGLSLHVEGATGSTGRQEILEGRNGTVTILTSGTPFFEPGGDGQEGKAERLGKKIYKSFTLLADEVAGFYGSIFSVRPFCTPEEMVTTPNDALLGDSFLSTERLGDSFVESLLAIPGDSIYREKLKTGVYFSTNAHFNPGHCRIDPSDWEEPSTKMARLLARQVQRLLAQQNTPAEFTQNPNDRQ